MTRTKLILNGANSESIVRLSADGLGDGLIIAPGISVTASNINSVLGNTIRIEGCNYIEVQNKSNLKIIANDIPLNDIVANQGTISLNNNYSGCTKTNITISSGSNINLSGVSLSMGIVSMEQNSSLVFTCGNSNFKINRPANANGTNMLVIKDMDVIIETAKYLNSVFSTLSIPLAPVSGKVARTYEKNKEAVDLFMKDNYKDLSERIEDNLSKWFLEITGVAHCLNGSDLEPLTSEIVGKICSYITCDEIL